MGPPRFRFTIRRLIIAVAGFAVLMFLYRSMTSIREFFDFGDTNYHASRASKQSWDAGPSPSITVDVFEGSILVVPSPDGKVGAETYSSVNTKNGQSDADGALETIELDTDHQSDTVRIIARGASETTWEGRILKEVFVKLFVPAGVQLDLRTGRGWIGVGRDYTAGNPVHCPIAASSVRARNDSPYLLGYAQGLIWVETIPVPHQTGTDPIHTRLQLDAAGRIEIVADEAIVEARAWHGKPPIQWGRETPEQAPYSHYPSCEEGTIDFKGTLAEGTHSLRAAHGIVMDLKPGAPLRIEAEAGGGKIDGDLLPEQTGSYLIWKGKLGKDARSLLKVKVDKGSITLRKSP